MLATRLQRELACQYGSKVLSEAFDQRLEKSLHVKFEGDHEHHAAIALIDIANFAAVANGRSATWVRDYLERFYEQVVPRVYEHGGLVDRIIGDAVVGVFSSFLNGEVNDETADIRALQVAVESVRALSFSGDMKCKASISSGPVLFCRTGLAAVYEDYTIIGEPLTLAYRQEEYAKANQVVIAEASLGWQVLSVMQPEKPKVGEARWQSRRKTLQLRGVGPRRCIVQEYFVPPILYIPIR